MKVEQTLRIRSYQPLNIRPSIEKAIEQECQCLPSVVYSLALIAYIPIQDVLAPFRYLLVALLIVVLLS